MEKKRRNEKAGNKEEKGSQVAGENADEKKVRHKAVVERRGGGGVVCPLQVKSTRGEQRLSNELHKAIRGQGEIKGGKG